MTISSSTCQIPSRPRFGPSMPAFGTSCHLFGLLSYCLSQVVLVELRVRSSAPMVLQAPRGHEDSVSLAPIVVALRSMCCPARLCPISVKVDICAAGNGNDHVGDVEIAIEQAMPSLSRSMRNVADYSQSWYLQSGLRCFAFLGGRGYIRHVVQAVRCEEPGTTSEMGGRGSRCPFVTAITIFKLLVVMFAFAEIVALRYPEELSAE